MDLGRHTTVILAVGGLAVGLAGLEVNPIYAAARPVETPIACSPENPLAGSPGRLEVEDQRLAATRSLSLTGPRPGGERTATNQTDSATRSVPPTRKGYLS